MSQYTYPNPPEGVPDSVIQPSAKFRKEVGRIITSLTGFGILYLLMVVASIIITICCGLIAWILVDGVRHWMALVLAVGLLGVGLMVMFFVIKFLFAKKKTDDTGYTEISESDYPDLFAFIRRISEETETSFPKHIYLSAEVNAAVFYDSSFWSMIFPVRKNLVIGLGLINMTNLSEFKAVIAHEFGHFSQKSMRAGSYVYHANKVIYNMLYENDSYGAALERWAGIHWAFALCARITIAIVRAMQWVLQQAYKAVNRQYMSLSRQMEFHADAVSAKAAGSNNAIHALRRLEFADACYSSVIERYNEWVPVNLKGKNLYSQQRIAATFIASDYSFPFVGGLPILHDADQHYKNFSRISIEDQWASHPTRHQREAAMNELGIKGIVVEESAWVLFPDAKALQETMTHGLYESVKFSAAPDLIPDEQFTEKYSAARKQYNFPAFYEGYYNSRTISTFDPEAQPAGAIPIDDLRTFFKAHQDLHPRLEAARGDVQTLIRIADKAAGIRSFDFDGSKYNRSEALLVKATLEQEIRQMEESLNTYDQAVFHRCIKEAGPGSKEAENLKERYKDYFELQQVGTDNITSCNHMMELIQPFYTSQEADAARKISTDLEEATELFKSRLEKVEAIYKNNSLTKSATIPESLAKCRSTEWRFMGSGNQFMGENLEALSQHVQDFGNWTFEVNFQAQKELLNAQLATVKSSEVA